MGLFFALDHIKVFVSQTNSAVNHLHTRILLVITARVITIHSLQYLNSPLSLNVLFFLIFSIHKFGYCCSKVRIEHGESSETPANNTESTDLVTSVAESGNDLDATLDKLDIDPKISENNQER